MDRIIPLLLVLALIAPSRASAQARWPAARLEAGFRNPPDSAKPRVWWHWMNGNITKEGITLDLEAIARIGLGGVQIFDADLQTPVVVPNPIRYMTPQWMDMLHHAVTEGKRLGLEMAIHSSAGWSETGGPWVKPEQAMQKLVWSETHVTGPVKFAQPLPMPPSVFGPYGAVAIAKVGDEHRSYADVAVLAYRAPASLNAGAAEPAPGAPRVTSNAQNFDARKILDGDPNTVTVLATVAKHGLVTVQLEYPRPFSVRSATVVVMGRAPPADWQASDDGHAWRTIATLPKWNRGRGMNLPRTISFDPVKARFFRFAMNQDPSESKPDPGARPPELGEIALFSEARINRFEDKAGFSFNNGYQSTLAVAPPASPTNREGSSIAASDVVDLTGHMEPGGLLQWNVPPGAWTIVRFGHSPTGKKNGPASVEGTGLECDKLSRASVTSYFNGFINPIAAKLGPLFGTTLRYILMDSWEAGLQNWSPPFMQEFRQRRGYDPLPYLPAMTGHIVGNLEISERFLWDVRRTIADLTADNHYGTFADLLHKRKLGLYAEAVGIRMPAVADQLQARGRADIPMGEFWISSPDRVSLGAGDCKEASSAAHIYGKNLVAAESFTAMPEVPAWSKSPYALKALGDRHLALGINRIVIHEYAHQPVRDKKPGFTLGPYGTQFNRMITWWDQAKAWMTYLSRSQFLLQQGLFAGDVVYFYGEQAPAEVPSPNELELADRGSVIDPAPPQGFDYDFTNAEVILTRMSARDGRIVLPDGMNYRVLVLPQDGEMSVAVLRKIRALLEGGIIVVGPKPVRSVGLSGYPQSDIEVKRLADEMWGGCVKKDVPCQHAVGAGKVVVGTPLADVLAGAGVKPDFEASAGTADARLVYIHRRIIDAGGTDIYFVSNQRERDEQAACVFRVDGKVPELWYPDSGRIEKSAPFTTTDGRTTVPIHFDPAGSVFVVFRKPGQPTGSVPGIFAGAPPVPRGDPITLSGPWEMRFAPGLGAPERMNVTALASWTGHVDQGVKFFSGTATYMTGVNLPANRGRGRGRRWLLDLGVVKEIAEVRLNGKDLGILWKPPFRVDITAAARPGPNKLEVRVTNLWPNRLIGDQNLPEEKRTTWTTHNPYKKDSPLLPSGLLGPVTLSGS